VVPAALFIRTHGVHLAGGSFLLNFLAGAVAFLLFVPVAWLSYSLIEKPFLKLRVKYSAAQKTT
jgi:peptidoglycan/LPS O-acetylase OafA/YrhL